MAGADGASSYDDADSSEALDAEDGKVGEDDEAGSGIGRVLAFSDGVFSIAATLLVLNLKLPRDLHGAALHHAISVLEGDVISAITTFLVIGLYWMGHRRLWSSITRTDRRLLQLNLGFLGLIILLPFGAQILGEYGDRWGAVAIYAGLIVVLSLSLASTAEYAIRSGLSVRHPAEEQANRLRTIVIATVFLSSIPIATLSTDWATREWALCWVALPLTFKLKHRVRARVADSA